ncbi:hypothetical protein QLH51_07810 [Sphingomonas sp. 2R-10]|uniref:hypothetical protein n=1 Tax=Sphingomonas sp. 2R-10 TaxID=3045148 RepID=UPI0019D1184D|nr:hypothetical protein [Sphingomonas sp. 2R-10]MDJ0276697.1 hypothetical protein [Sphingomonas sp. 2R-10]
MLPTEPLQLYHSWPLFERGVRLPQGVLRNGYTPDLPDDGQFSCDLRSNTLTWHDSTFALFGLPIGSTPRRDVTLPMYAPESRSALQRLRAHAIRHCRGFTIDTEIDAPGQPKRWLRVTAMAEVQDGRSVRLHGLHQDVTHEYR